jgi:chromate transporter
VLKPAVVGTIAAGIIKLGSAAIRNVFLGVLLGGSIAAMYFLGVNFLLILLMAGLLNLLKEKGWSRPPQASTMFQVAIVAVVLIAIFTESRLLQIAWLFFKTGLLSFGGAYAAIIFVQRGAVAEHAWLTDAQLLDGVALSVATPGPFMLFSTFAGYLAGGVAGAIVATFFVFLPSFVFVLGGAHYVEKVQDNATIQAFLSGVSAAVVGVIAVVSVELIPEAIVGWPTMLIAAAAFLAIVWWKRDVALVAIGGIVGGVIYAIVTYQ